MLKEGTIISENQNFTKTAAQEDSGMYTCTASIGKVVKRSNTVWIVVCGEYVLAEMDWEEGNCLPTVLNSHLQGD